MTELLAGHGGVNALKAGATIKQTLSSASVNVAKGLYDATTLPAVDADLVAANINTGITIFGIAGTLTGGNQGLAPIALETNPTVVYT